MIGCMSKAVLLYLYCRRRSVLYELMNPHWDELAYGRIVEEKVFNG